MANHPTNSHNDSHGHGQGHAHHHILANKMALTIFSCLLVLTILTVAVAHVDLGKLNFLIAMAIATAKASLVALFFMGLFYDRKENGVIFATSFIFLAIFIVLTSTDLFFRGDVYVKGPLMAATGGKSKIAKPWISTPQLVAHGKELFMVQCVACHGPEGKGDGPAASALSPHPRNFTSDEGWKNGRKATMVFKTLKEGLPPSAMASFATLPPDDRWALAHYVLSLGPSKPAADAPEDFAKIGVDTTKAGGGAEEEKTIPIELAMARIAQPEQPAARAAHGIHGTGPGAELYAARCEQCHGEAGQGGVKVKNLGENPKAFVTTQAFTQQRGSIQSEGSFSQVVTRGLPGDLMPGAAELSASELRELFGYVRSLASAR